MLFRPTVNMQLTIGNGVFYFTEHPSAKGMPYGQTGRRGTVYQVQDQTGKKHALKIFTKAFRSAHNARNAIQLEKFSTIPGLQVCKRIVLTPQNYNALLNQYTELEHAVIMPWINGQTWHDVLLSRQAISGNLSLELARGLSNVLARMGKNNIAHCDLSGPNILLPGLLTGQPSNIELVDVEEMFAPGLSKPDKLPGGSDGYGHRSGKQGYWSADADRFSGALLLAEILGWCDNRVRNISTPEHYFDTSELQTNCDRYQILLQVLGVRYGEKIADLFTAAWFSQNLSDCPKFSDWENAISSILSTHQNIPIIPHQESIAGKSKITLPTFKPDYVPIQPPKDNLATQYKKSNPIAQPKYRNLPTHQVAKQKKDISWGTIFFGIAVTISLFVILGGGAFTFWNYRENNIQEQNLIINLNDFYNGRILPVYNKNGSHIGQIETDYGYFYGSGEKAQDPNMLATVRISLLLNSGQSSYISFATGEDSLFGSEKQTIPEVGKTYIAMTNNYRLKATVTNCSAVQNWDNEVPRPFQDLVINISIENR